MQEARKACVDCRHYYEPWGSACDRDELKTWDNVSGWQDSDPTVNRNNAARCGEQGRYWVPKPPKACLLGRLFGG